MSGSEQLCPSADSSHSSRALAKGLRWSLIAASMVAHSRGESVSLRESGAPSATRAVVMSKVHGYSFSRVAGATAPVCDGSKT